MKLFTNKELWIWVLASLLVINIAITGTILWRQQSVAGPPPHFPGSKLQGDKRHQMGFKKWHEKMGFTHEQDKRLKDELDKFLSISDNIFQQLRENQQQIFEEMKKAKPDTVILFRLAEETGTLHAGLRKESLMHILSTKEITTPEQFEKMSEMMQQWILPDQMKPGPYREHRPRRPDFKDSCNKMKK